MFLLQVTFLPLVIKTVIFIDSWNHYVAFHLSIYQSAFLLQCLTQSAAGAVMQKHFYSETLKKILWMMSV